MRSLALFLCLALTACGGGGGSSPSPPASSSTSSSSAPTDSTSSNVTNSVSGVAATGSPIAGRIYLKDAVAHEQYVDTTDGSYTFSTTGLTPPFMLKAEWVVNGVTQKLYSFSLSGGTANITPLTQIAVSAAAATNALDAVYASPSIVSFTLISNALPAAISDLQTSLRPLLTKYSASDTDPISGKFAADHTGMDALLDGITVTYSSGNIAIADKTSGAIILDAPTGNLSHGLSIPDWSAQDAAIANDPDVAVDKNGNSLVVWSERVGSNYVIRARFLSGNASAVTLSTSGDAGLPRVAYDSSGNAIVVWAQYENNRNDIWTSLYAAASKTWSTPVRISAINAVSSAYVPDIGIDGSGNAIVTWHQGDGRTNHFDAWAVWYTATSNSWGAPSLISDGVNSAYDCRVAVNTSGKGIVAWEQEQGDGTTVSNGPKDVWGRNVTTAGTRGTSTKLNAVAGNIDYVYGQIATAMDTSGNGFVLWVQGSGILPFVIQAARYSATSGWQSSAVITNNAVDSSYGPHIAFDSAGNAVAVWQQQTGVGAYGGTNRFVAGSGWGVSGKFADEAAGDIYDPHVAVDGDGNATAVWYQWEQSGINVRTNRYLAGSGWGTSRIISTTLTDGGFTYPVPRVTTNTTGQTVAVWGIDSY